MSNSTKQNKIKTPDSFSPAQLDAEGFPAPSEGFIVTHLLIVADQDRSRDFYSKCSAAKLFVNLTRRW